MNYTVSYITKEHTLPRATFLNRPDAEAYARSLWRMSLLPRGYKSATDVQVSSDFDGSKWSARARSFLANAHPDTMPAAANWLGV